MKFYTKRSDSRSGYLYKFLLVMRLITILFFVGIMHVSAATYGQKVSLNQKNMTIKEVFKEIKRQTGYDVLWQTGKLDANRRVNMHFNDAALAQIMRACLKNDQFDFEILDESIIIKEKPALSEAANSFVNQDSTVFKGMVADEKGRPLTGATVKVKGGTKTTFTTTKGTFAIYGPKKGALIISYIGYLSKEITLTGLDPRLQIEVKLIPGANDLGEVNVVSTGYQDLPKERATGSFEVITKEQLQHSTDPNLLKRLEGITTSMNFNNQLTSSNSASTQNIGGAPSPLNNLTIRGANTFAATHSFDNQSGIPLVVIDGIASPYSIDLINPNDVESITILKDAAAASIWGSRAANGVIVVKTKRGGYNKPVTVSFNSNFNVTDKLDLFYMKTMTVSDYIDAEIRRFNNNNVTLTKPIIGRPQRNISPVDEILGNQKSGLINANQANAQLDALRGNDIRKDYTKYFLRNALRQSYSLAIDGGSKYVSYRLSAGYDKSLNNTQNSDFNRIAINYNVSVHPFKNFELTGNITYSSQHNNDQAANNRITGISDLTFYPYTRLADDQGNFLSIPKLYRPVWVNLLQSTYGDKVLNLNYIPLEDINEGYQKIKNQNVNLGLTSSYKISSDLSANVTYNYSTGRSQANTLYRQNSFYMRDRINLYTSPPGATDQYGNDISFKHNLPLGGQLQTNLDEPINQTLRGQLNYNKVWNEKHVLSAIAGIDVSQNFVTSTANTYYGYNEDNLSNSNNLPYNILISPLLYTTSTGSPVATLPSLPSSFSSLKIRTVGIFSNVAYTYDRKYTISGSVRKDASSEFGIGTNNRGTPFWSTGGSWSIQNEDFYHVTFLPVLQFRATYGYNGNVNPIVSANPLLSYSTGPSSDNGLLYAELNGTSGISNSKLRPEKTGMLNIGLNFGFPNNRISGSIEYYNKRTTDLISSVPVDPTTGYDLLPLNSANIRGWGTDFTLNSINFQHNRISWTSNFLFSYNREQVTKLYLPSAQTAVNVIANSGTSAYSVGYDLSRVFAFKWAGLDPVTGDPRGYLNGQVVSISSDQQGNTTATNIFNGPLSSIRYFGSAVPVYFGSLRNNFSYGGFTVSVNILYKLGYYFRRAGNSGPVNYSNLFNSRALLGDEYEKRWQRPGDELTTNVPSLTFPLSSNRDTFYALSDINVLKADHVRLQEINFSYGFNKKNWFLKNPRLYFNMSNLGIIWRANKLGLDPDTFDYPIPKTYSFGFSTSF